MFLVRLRRKSHCQKGMLLLFCKSCCNNNNASIDLRRLRLMLPLSPSPGVPNSSDITTMTRAPVARRYYQGEMPSHASKEDLKLQWSRWSPSQPAAIERNKNRPVLQKKHLQFGIFQAKGCLDTLDWPIFRVCFSHRDTACSTWHPDSR